MVPSTGPSTAGSLTNAAAQRSRTAWRSSSGYSTRPCATESSTATPLASPAGNTSSARPRTNSMILAPSPCPTGQPSPDSPTPSWPGQPTTSAAGATSSSSPPAPAPASARCPAAAIGDIDTHDWTWTVRRQTTPSPGGLADKGTKGKRARDVPLIVELRDLIQRRIDATNGRPDARLFTGPRGGRITTAVLRDATHWDDVVAELGYEHLRRHGLRHTGLTWMADAGVPVHVLRKIAGHGSLTTTQRYLHPDRAPSVDAGDSLSAHLRAPRSPNGPQRRSLVDHDARSCRSRHEGPLTSGFSCSTGLRQTCRDDRI